MGGDKGVLKRLPDHILDVLFDETNGLLANSDRIEQYENIILDFKDKVNQIARIDNDIIKVRSTLGNNKGAVGNVSGENVVNKIWDIISPSLGDISCDQYFGFNPINKQGYEHWPMFLGIIGCCGVMDVIGFRSEQKCRKLDKVPNVRSDSVHIGMGAFCSLIISKEERLVKRANVIYEYKGIGSSATLLELQKTNIKI